MDYDLASDSFVSYGITSTLGSVESDTATTTAHAVALSSLAPGTEYLFAVSSTGATGDTAVDDNNGDFYTFTTELEPEPLAISEVQVIGVATSTATVTWITNLASDSFVSYGTTSTLGSVQSDTATTTAHSVTLTNLTAGTDYLFAVSSTDAAGDTAVDDNGGDFHSFTTELEPESLAISDVQVIGVATSTATITWTTNLASDSFVSYATTSTLGLVQSDTATTTTHSVSLTGLVPGTEYLFAVSSTDAAGDTAVDDNGGDFYSFTTQSEAEGPSISDVQVVGITPSSAIIAWTTNFASDSSVSFGTSTELGLSETDPTTTTLHAILLSNLRPNNEYFFEVESTGGDGNSVVDDNDGEKFRFTTAAEEVQPEGAVRSFPGVIQGDPDEAITLIRQGIGEVVEILVTEDLEIRTPGGPRAGTFEAGARVVVLARLVGGRWTAIRVLVKPVHPNKPIVGVVVESTSSTVTVINPDGSAETFDVAEGTEVPEPGEIVTAFGGSDSKAKGLVRAEEVRQRLKGFLDDFAETEDDSETENGESTADHIESLVDALEDQSAKANDILDEVIERVPETAKAAVAAAKTKINQAKQDAQATVERASQKAKNLKEQAGANSQGTGSGGSDDGDDNNEDDNEGPGNSGGGNSGQGTGSGGSDNGDDNNEDDNEGPGNSGGGNSGQGTGSGGSDDGDANNDDDNDGPGNSGGGNSGQGAGSGGSDDDGDANNDDDNEGPGNSGGGNSGQGAGSGGSDDGDGDGDNEDDNEGPGNSGGGNSGQGAGSGGSDDDGDANNDDDDEGPGNSGGGNSGQGKGSGGSDDDDDNNEDDNEGPG